jgi:hypothetical protein
LATSGSQKYYGEILAKGKAVASRQGNKKQNEWSEDLLHKLGMVAATNRLWPRPKWRSDSNSSLVGEGNQGISSAHYFMFSGQQIHMLMLYKYFFLQAGPNLKKFRHGNPDYLPLLHDMYHEVVADGSSAYVPGTEEDLETHNDDDLEDANEGFVASPMSTNTRKRGGNSTD